MKPNVFDITILCKVVDNFGDIGFVYRLAKNLLKINPHYKIRIIASNLSAFKKLAPQIDENLPQQEFLGMKIFDWNACDICRKEFTENAPRLILECFQCGRPDWLEEILFNDKSNENFDTQNGAIQQISQIINIDYLTAESYAEEFHLLKSGTRSAFVRKVNFMPGFTAKTGGLILDEPFAAFNTKKLSQEPKLLEAGVQQPQGVGNKKASQAVQLVEGAPKILIFSYPKDFAPIFRAIKRFCDNLICKLQIFVAQGAGKESILASALFLQKGIENTNTDRGAPTIPNGQEQFAITELPFLSQEDWDKTLLDMDILFIRGEDSLSRACLCGKPFVWNAYIQDEDYHLVKVAALLERMRTHFAKKEFAIVENFWLLYNGKGKEENDYSQKLENACLEFLRYSKELTRGFISFSKSLFAIGNFTEKLDEFISALQI